MATPFRLITLGSLQLLGAPDAEGRRLIAQPKRCALLLYLALARPVGLQRRDPLLALLWPELDESHARNALSQALHSLRRLLGSDVVEGIGADGLRLNRDRITVDVDDFERMSQEGNSEAALSLYQGDLAIGFHVADAPGFERWLEDERQRLRYRAFAAAVAVADAADCASDPASAATALQRARQLRPEDESIVQRLMLVQEAAGDRLAALQTYNHFTQWLEQELETKPSAETEVLAARLRRPGPLATAAAPLAQQERQAVIVTPRRTRLRQVLLVVLPLMLLTAAWRVFTHAAVPPASAVPSVLVAPFRVAEGDTALLFLREGMVDLLGAKLTGEAGPRALDSRTVLSGWRDAHLGEEAAPAQVRALAHSLGAQQAITGSVLGNGSRVILQAELTGGNPATAEVEGRLDSLAALVDQLAAQLLLRQAGEPGPRLPTLVGHPLPALVAYLDGRRSYRAGDYDHAARAFRTALDIDSTLVLAALYRADAIDWVGSDDAVQARNEAWAARQRLGPADRAYLLALLGPRYPIGAITSDRIAAWEQAAAVTPERAEVWFGLGDVLYHRGSVADVPQADERARAAFERALATDSSYAAPLAHLADIMLDAHDESAASLVAKYLQVDSVGGTAWYLRWRMGSEREGEAAHIKLTDLPSDGLFRIAVGSQLHGVAPDDGRRAAQLLVERAITARELQAARRLRWLVAANTGHLTEFEQFLREALTTPFAPMVLAQSFGDGGRRWSLPDSIRGSLYFRYFGTLGRLWAGDSVDEAEVAALGNELSRSAEPWTPEARIEFQAMRDCRAPAPGGAPSLGRLDSLISAGPPEMDWNAYRPLLLARCHERRGDRSAALRAIRRRPNEAWGGIPYLPTYLWEEGRLALATGDSAAALEAWSRYLNLRAGADPDLQPRVREVRTLRDALRPAPQPRRDRRIPNPG